MLPSLHKTLFVFAPSIASALTATTASAPTSLPTSLQSLVPECAWSCLESILFDEFPLSCSLTGDLDCLCSQYSTSGLTLGEAAYGCSATACPSSTSNTTSTYGICSGQDGAVAPTHSVLTFTARITGTADSSTRTRSPSTTASSTLSTSKRSSTSSRSFTSTAVGSQPTTASTSTHTSSGSTRQTSVPVTTTAAATSSASTVPEASATAASDATSSSHDEGLSTSQVIGISVASVSAVVVAVGALFLLACSRRRNKGKEDDWKQEKSMFALTPPTDQNAIMSPSDFVNFPTPPRDAKDPRSGAGGVGIAVPQIRVNDRQQRRDGARTPTPLAEIGVAISPDTPPLASPASMTSTRTVSQLLPDKPEAPVAAPAPAQPKPVLRPESSATQHTLFEEDTALRRSLHPVRAVEVPARLPALSLTIPPQGSKVVPRLPTPSPPVIPSPLRIAKPPNAPRGRPTTPPPSLPPLLPSAHASTTSSSSTTFTGTSTTTPGSSGSSSYIPAYYTSPSSITQTPPQSYRGAILPLPPVYHPLPPVYQPPRPYQAYRQPSTYQQPYPQPQPRTPPSTHQPQARGQPQPRTPPRTHQPSSAASPRPPIPHLRTTSSTSMTSIESASPEDHTPPEDEQTQLKQLVGGANTAVEAGDKSPIAGLRYPKVPRASNQAVPRSPMKGQSPKNGPDGARHTQWPGSALSPTMHAGGPGAVVGSGQAQNQGLLARRRGEGKAEELGKRLYIEGAMTASSHGSDSGSGSGSGAGGDAVLPGSRSGSGSKRPPPPPPSNRDSARKSSAALPQSWVQGGGTGDVGIKTPLWAPRLTPTKRGEDLYIAVAYTGK